MMDYQLKCRPSRFRFSPAFRTLSCTALIACVVVMASTANAQGGDREKRERILRGILQILVDSQRPPQRNLQPPPPNVSPQMLALRKTLGTYAQESQALHNSLQREAIQHNELRTLAADSLRAHARAKALSTFSQQTGQPNLLIRDARDLDTNWRRLSYRLQGVSVLSPQCRDCVKRIDVLHADLCRHLQIEPQIDRTELARCLNELSFDLRRLAEDVDFELPRSNQRSEVLRNIGRARQVALECGESVTRGVPYARLVDLYGDFLKEWNPIGRQLGRVESRYIERALIRIQESDNTIHELLRLPRRLNRELLSSLTTGIMVEVDRIYDSVSLALLITLPRYEDVPADASEFYGICQHFADCVERRESREDLVEAYGYLPAAWVQFASHFRDCPQPNIRRSLQEIEQRLVALRDPLRIPGTVNPELARQRAAALEHLAEHLRRDISVWLQNNQFAADRQALARLCTEFESAARSVHVAVTQHRQLSEVEKLSDACAEKWRALHQRLIQCQAPDRDHIDELVVKITEELIAIEAMLLI